MKQGSFLTVKALADSEELEIVCLPSPEEWVSGLYAGDLLSFVMGRAAQGDAWVTIMNNINTLAVASLAECACIIIAEGSPLSEEFIQTAQQKLVNVLRSRKTTAQLCFSLGKRLGWYEP